MPSDLGERAGTCPGVSARVAEFMGQTWDNSPRPPRRKDLHPTARCGDLHGQGVHGLARAVRRSLGVRRGSGDGTSRQADGEEVAEGDHDQALLARDDVSGLRPQDQSTELVGTEGDGELHLVWEDREVRR